MFTVETVLTIPEPKPVNGRLERTFRDTKSKLFGFIRSRVSDSEDAEDILQDVFYQLAAADPEDEIAEVTSWLFTVARNKITDRYRKKKPDTFSSLVQENSDNELPEFDDENSLPPDIMLEESDFRNALMAALSELPKAQRDVFIMHEIEGIPYEEIVRITGEKLNTLLSRKRYAVKYLQKKLKDFEE